MEPFAENPIDNLASTSFCTELEANGGVSGDVSHKFNSIRHGPEAAETVTVEKLQKSPTDHQMKCFKLGTSLCRG